VGARRPSAPSGYATTFPAYVQRVAQPERRLPGNVPGDLFVDDACIACDTCRRVAPATFGGGEDDMAFVARQPGSAAERHRALMALVACPVAAIGTRAKDGITAAARAFPEEMAPGIYACGWAARASFGAAAYLVVRAGGNVLVDSPRFSRPLAERIRALGGIRLLFLTHRDDVADHEVFARRFGCRRVLCAADVTAATAGVELQPRGRGPVRLADDLLVVPAPGHTRGSAVLLHGDTLFTGDHLWAEDGRLHASRGVCWHSWSEQKASLAALRALSFRRVMPGHGAWLAAPSAQAMRAELELLLARLG
jgi:glyoxylase-like metal-dependent hydrolase (beta-lactamase superfamily II)/ferredoxin